MAQRNPTLCRDKRPCFARNGGRCVILSHTYENTGDCPFQKSPDKYEDDRIKAEIKGAKS